MHTKSDFDKMTLDELTPIVSMRPGKEYTKEELRAARMAFMEKLGCANPEIETEDEPESTESFDLSDEEPSLPELVPLSDAFMPATPPASACDEEADSEVIAPVENASPILPEENSEEPTASPANDSPAMLTEETPSVQPDTIDVPQENVEESVCEPFAETSEENDAVTDSPEIDSVEEKSEDAIAPSDNTEEFILKTENKLARFLYCIYAFFLLPLLAIESIGLLVASVGTCVAATDTPYIVLNVICASVYALIISLSWHQFLCRTSLGLLLNRSLICVCVMRGFFMITSGSDLLMGIIFIALSALFLIYFIGYDNMFTISSQRKRHVR